MKLPRFFTSTAKSLFVGSKEGLKVAKTLSDSYMLQLVNDVTSDDVGTPYRLLATGSDPYLFIKPSHDSKISAGWYCVYLHISCPGTIHSAKLYADLGAGFSEEEAYRLAYKPGQPVMQVVHFPSEVNTLRFDPQEVAGSFDLISFQLSPLSESDAAELMLNTLGTMPKYSSGSINKLRDDLTMVATTQGVPFSSVVYQEYSKEVSPAPSYGSSGASYHSWIDNVEKQQLHSLELIQKNLKSWVNQPKFSVLIPTYNTEEKYLRACINSVIDQSYGNWELCIADDCSPSSHVRAVLDEYALKDKRIKTVYRKENGHISKATNSALELATGEFAALLDHDDTLAKDALYHMVEKINEQPTAQIIYSDEDWIDTIGTRVRPHFKSDWNPDLFYSHNYITHLCVYKKELISSVGGLREGVEGSQDYDLLLRCISKINEKDILHIPRVLYHWRAIEGSTALSAGEKSYSDDAGLVALTEYFSARYPELASVVNADLPNMYKVNWNIPDPAPLVSLLMPTRDQKKVTEVAVRSILNKSTYTNFELLIIDNGSEKQETLDFFDTIQGDDSRVKVVRYDAPFNYPAINNFGFEHAKGDLIGLINNDVEVITPEWLTELVSHASRPDIGCVGAKLYYENNSVQHGGVMIGIGGVAGHSHRGCPRYESGYVGRLLMVQNLSAVTAACLLVKKSIYEEAKGLDETNLAVAFNDVDFCLKVQELGYRNLWTPFAELYHYESISRGYEDTPEKLERFDRESTYMKKRWKIFLEAGDPYYSRNLTLSREDFSLDA